MAKSNAHRKTNLIFDPLLLNQLSKTGNVVPQSGPPDCTYFDLGELENLPLNTSNFLFLHVNCRSIRKNFQSLQNFLLFMKVKPFAIAITESWLVEGEEIFFTLPGFDFISIPRPYGEGGG